MRDFKLSPSFMAAYEGQQPKWGFNGLGYVVYKRTYARLKDDGKTEEFWETCQRVVEGVYSAQKHHARALKLPWNNEKAQRSAQEMYRRMWEFKWLPPGRGLWMMGTDYIDRVGSAALNNPLHEDTPILTRSGWKPIKELAGQQVELLSNTKLYARDHSSTSASPVWVTGTVSDYEEQPCVKITSRDKAGITTELIASVNHRWYRRSSVKKPWERVTSEELVAGDYLPITRPAKNYPLSKFGAQHGLFFGDGTRSNGELHQFASSAAVLRDLFVDAEHVTSRREDEWVVRNCPKSRWSVAPTLEDEPSYVYGFLAGYFAADGSVSEAGQCRLASARRGELAAVRQLFLDLGIRAHPIRMSSTASNYSSDRELYEFCVHRHDLSEEFFLKAEHKRRWLAVQKKITSDYAKVLSVEPCGTHRVLCATVPEKEQFVVDGFVLTSNCGFSSTATLKEDFAEPFCWAMDMLMLGVGVGFDTTGAGSVTIRKPKQGSDIHTVPDTREGWVDLLRRTLNAYVGRGTMPREVDYSLVRKAGEPIKGFGGTASGPDPLKELIESVITKLSSLENQPITSDAIVDISNFIGRCVVAGNVRRSAEIAFGSPYDLSFLELKDPAKFEDELRDYRWASNNSVFADVGMDYTAVAKYTVKNGEPGFEWLENAQDFSRMGRAPDYKDRRARGGNPCLEQTLEDRELCCLVETFPSMHDSYDDYERTLKYAYLYAKSVTLISSHCERTNSVMMRNRRIGCSMSGIVQAMQKHGRREFFNWCDQGYDYLENLDDTYSEWLCIPRSIKKTSVKPSGTVSLLPGVTPGIHYPHSEYYLRRIRMQAGHPLLETLAKMQYHIEDDAYSPGTKVVSFPIHEESFDRSKRQVSMWEQLENAAQMQTYWADNQVSITVTFKPEEAQDIKYALELYETRLKGVSFLALEDHGYVQAPYEEITKEEYEKYVSNLRGTDIATELHSLLNNISIDDAILHDTTERFCTNDVCEIKKV